MKIQYVRTGRILVTVFFLVITASLAVAEEPTIIKVVGKAEISKLTENQDSPATVGVKLKPGDIITVAGKGHVVIQIGTNTIRARINENTKIEYSGQSFFRNVQCFELYEGRIRFSIEKGNKLDLQTPHMVASVRGTEFIAHTTDTASSVSVLLGKVLTKDILGNKKILEANTYAIAGPKGIIKSGKGRASPTMDDPKNKSKNADTGGISTGQEKSKKDKASKSKRGQGGSVKNNSDKKNSDKGRSGQNGSDKNTGGQSADKKDLKNKS